MSKLFGNAQKFCFRRDRDTDGGLDNNRRCNGRGKIM